MSEFTENYKHRINLLNHYLLGLYNGENGSELVKKYEILEHQFMPIEIVSSLDFLVNRVSDFEKIKIVSNKLFNILYNNLILVNNNSHSDKLTFIKLLDSDNNKFKSYLERTRPLFKEINKSKSQKLIDELKSVFESILSFSEHYVVMQNIVFPEIEKRIKHHNCLKIMWAFHDDIIKNAKRTIDVLNDEIFDLKTFNQISSKVYFNIYSIIFRETYVLFPIIMDLIEDNTLLEMQNQLSSFNLAFSKAEKVPTTSIENKKNVFSSNVLLRTGEINIEQLELIFDNLPVDITYVDDNDTVVYYSDPKHRIFPRTISIIGRKVQNCHPHDSVHIVNKIVESFKSGKKDEASFWIKMGDKFILIKYIALRNSKNEYKGVLEVSQEVSDIRKLKGEKRLLDW